MSDAFEDQARALAHSIPVCDLGSIAGIRAIAIGLRETWRMARESRDAEVQALMDKAAQNYREIERLRKVIRPFGEAGGHAFVVMRDSKPASSAIYDRVAAYYVSWVDYKRAWEVMSGMGMYPAPALEQTTQNEAEMIRAAHARAEAAEAERDRLAAELKEIGLEPFQRKGSKRVIGSEEITPPALSSTTESQT